MTQEEKRSPDKSEKDEKGEVKEPEAKEPEVKEPDETPPPGPEEEETVDPEKLKQQLNTQTGLLKKAQQRLKELEKQHLDFGEVKTALGGIQERLNSQNETLNLVTDVLNQMGEGNEELQQKVAEAKQAREKTQQQIAQAQTAYGDIMNTLQLAEIGPDDKEAEPVRDAFNAKDYTKAKQLATVAVKTKISAMKIAPKEDEDKGEEEKGKKQKVITKTPGAPEHWREQSPHEKIKGGLEDAKK